MLFLTQDELEWRDRKESLEQADYPPSNFRYEAESRNPDRHCIRVGGRPASDRQRVLHEGRCIVSLISVDKCW
jgi:hypothetical protein